MQRISVIIPTKDRPGKLEILLRSIEEAGDNYYELLVVDSSTKESNLNMNYLNTIKHGGKHIVFNEKGLSKARNKGIKESKGDILVFSDDDFIVKRGWINNLIPNFDDPEVFCVTGRMISYRNDETSRLYERAMSFDRGAKKRIFSEDDLKIINLFQTITKIGQKRLYEKTPVPWAVGYGFCAFRKQVFWKIGFFDENLGRGTRNAGGEDIDIFYRILKAGYKIVYEPSAIVFHDHRENLEQIFKDAYQGGISIRSFIAKYPKDLYLRFIFLGYVFLTFFSGIKAALESDFMLKRMIKMELRGFLTRP
ncbi:MAG: glycosyltransferase [Candidatus Bathyarchaeia archaeon]